MIRPSKRTHYPSKEDLTEAYRFSSVPKIAKHFDMGAYQIMKLMKEYNIPRHPTGYRPAKLNDLHLEDIKARYKSGESQASIAKSYATTATTILNFMSKNDIPRRSCGKRLKYEGEFATLVLVPSEIKRLYKSGTTLKQIAILYGISYVDLYNFARRHDIVIVNKPENLLHLATPEIIKGLYENGMLMKDIAAKFNVGLLTLYKYRKQYNVLVERGRKPLVATTKLVQTIKDLYAQGLSAQKISKKLEISYHRILKIMKPIRAGGKYDRKR